MCYEMFALFSQMLYTVGYIAYALHKQLDFLVWPQFNIGSAHLH